MEPKEIDEITLSKLALEYADEDKARAFLESLRWPNGPVCPHCQSKEHYLLKGRPDSKSPARKGLCKCKECKKQYTVTVRTIFADSKIPLGKWLMAFFILGSSKKAISSHQMHRMLGVTYKTAWFMTHRIRHAFAPLIENGKMHGDVEMDETFVGGRGSKKTPVLALIAKSGQVRTRVVDRITHRNIGPFLRDNVARGATLVTDANPRYKTVYLPQVKHESVNHSAEEYSRERADRSKVHINHCESFFSLLKRGVVGSFHHVSQEHLHRYCDEFAFRWNTRKMTDGERFVMAIKATEGKRLKYQNTVAA